MKTTVAIERSRDYSQENVDTALFRACEEAGFPDIRGKSVLLKPNILGPSEPDKAVTTHPAILRAAIRYARSKRAAVVLVGESPPFQVALAAFKKSGLLQACEEEGAEWVDFGEQAQYENPEGVLVKNFTFAKAAMEADVLVSLAKLKTHSFQYFTGAMKNLFGCVPGLQKPQFHMRFPERERFGRMIVDLNVALRPEFAILDGIIGMEGPGPGSGDPKELGLVLASKDPLALDRTACRLIRLDPSLVPYLEEALGRGIWVGSDEEIEIVGESLDSAKASSWKQVPRGRMPGKAMPRALRDLMVARPFFSVRKCIACGRCVAICPANALVLEPRGKERGKIFVDYEKCIRCYCCHEICPADAITLRRRPL